MDLASPYIPRIADSRLKHLLSAFGAVNITGPKWCGKTWTATHHASSADSLANFATREAALTEPDLVLRGEAPHLIDEWQEVPHIWDATRNRIDQLGNKKGQFILTGSTQPRNSQYIRHSGTGRIAQLKMYPMTLSEALYRENSRRKNQHKDFGISFFKLFEGVFTPQRRNTSIDDIARWCCRGGWPSILDLPDDLACETPAEYIRNVAEESLPRLGKNPSTGMAILSALARNTAQAVRPSTLINDLGSDASVTRPTLDSYLDALRSLFIIEELPSWAPQLRSKVKALARPKTHFVDPSLPASLLAASPSRLLRDTQTLGMLFETLVLRDLRVFTSVAPGIGNTISYYRDALGEEIDFIAQIADGRWAGIETKLSDNAVTDEAAAKLIKTAAKVTNNLASQAQPPSFLAFIVGKGDFAYQRNDGIYVLPAALLRP